ncbi:MAG: hypothetical protein RIA69_05625 [Cyclobacteriaceae bacterium]
MAKYCFSRIALLSILVAFTFSCTEKKTKQVTSETMTASGEYLFEGPNTLQGDFSFDISALSSKTGVTAEDISEVYVESIRVIFENSETQEVVESVLIQLVSDELPLQSAGTLTTFTGTESLLNANKELDILSYLKDPSSQLIVDANLKSEMDELSVSVVFEFTVKH